jgi:acetyltransferase EpsM
MGAARLAGKVTVDDGAYIGINATISNDIHIGAWSVIGAGAVVIRDVEPGAVMIGNPARVLRMNPVPPHSGAIR